MIFIIIGIILLILFLYSTCNVSSRCSRLEEGGLNLGIEYTKEEKTRKNNYILRLLLDNSYFMEPSERLTYQILLQCAYILHEDPCTVTDEEIAEIRSFSEKYCIVHNNVLPKSFDEDITAFTNRIKFNATNDIKFEELKDRIIDELYYGSENVKFEFVYDSNTDSIYIKKYSSETFDIEYFIYDLDTKKLDVCNEKISFADSKNIGTYFVRDIKI